MNFVQIKKELLIALRGERTQVEISRMLGYSFNQWHKWESEQKWMRWNEFVEVLRVLMVPIEDVFRELYAFKKQAASGRDLDDFRVVLDCFCAGWSTQKVAGILKQDEDVIRRWVREGVSPSLETVLFLIQERTNDLSTFVANLVPIQQIPTLRDFHQTVVAHKAVEVKYPFSAAVEACFLLESYKALEKHSDEWIADRVKVPVKLVQELIATLVQQEIVENRSGKYQLLKQTDLRGISKRGLTEINGYWARRGLGRLDYLSALDNVPATDTPDAFMFRVAAVSRRASEEIRAKLLQCSRDVYDIIIADEDPPVEVRAILTHYFETNKEHVAAATNEVHFASASTISNP